MDGNGVDEEHDAIPPDAMDRTPPIIAAAVVVVTPLPRATAETGAAAPRSHPTVTSERARQVTVIIDADRSDTSISSLSSALVAAQASASLLAQQNQQLHVASASAVSSAQAAAQLSASSLVASLSSSASVALASAAGQVTSANMAASAALQTANSAMASMFQVSPKPARAILISLGGGGWGGEACPLIQSLVPGAGRAAEPAGRRAVHGSTAHHRHRRLHRRHRPRGPRGDLLPNAVPPGPTGQGTAAGAQGDPVQAAHHGEQQRQRRHGLGGGVLAAPAGPAGTAAARAGE